MSDYPKDMAGRRAARKRIDDNALVIARKTARSLTCTDRPLIEYVGSDGLRTSTHATCSGASHCLCECHDGPIRG